MCFEYIHRFKVLRAKNPPSNKACDNKKVKKKPAKTKTLNSSKEENDETSKRKTKIFMQMYFWHVIT